MALPTFAASASKAEMVIVPSSFQPTSISAPYAMPVNFQYEKLHSVYPAEPFDLLGVAHFTVSFTGRMDVQNGVIIAVDSCRLEYNISVPLISHDLDVDYTITPDNRIEYTISGEMEFNWSIVGLGNYEVFIEGDFSPDDDEFIF